MTEEVLPLRRPFTTDKGEVKELTLKEPPGRLML